MMRHPVRRPIKPYRWYRFMTGIVVIWMGKEAELFEHALRKSKDKVTASREPHSHELSNNARSLVGKRRATSRLDGEYRPFRLLPRSLLSQGVEATEAGC